MSEHLREEEFIPYLDGRLSEAERERLDVHLAACAACRAHCGELRALLGVLGEWKAAEPSPAFDAALRARLAEEATPPPRWYSLRPVFAGALAAAILLALGVVLWEPGAPDAGPPVVTRPPSPSLPTGPPGNETPPGVSGDDLAVLENPVLLENYELLEEFDILFEPAEEEDETL
ncbi:zf-HC2 domain-containing protein [Acidobacteriia bacterium AH_259_A11_L15]|nr:zf-HC2 domain-containing protein [Acidobacteriia bacterium AH_259_A11_L15]